MARPARERCIRCDGHVDDVGTLSSRYRCRSCGVGALTETLDQLHAHDGPRFDHWRRRLLAAFGVNLPEPKAAERD